MKKLLLVLVVLAVVLMLAACGGECNHDYVVDEVIEATCQREGYTVYECSKCYDRIQKDYVSATEHNYEMTDHGFPLYDAWAKYECTYCDSWYEENHQVEEPVIVEPTCTEFGYTVYSCSCGYTINSDYGDYYADHQYGEGVLTPSTCTEHGYTTYTCSCGEAWVDEEPLQPHTEETVAGKAATCDKTGLTDGKKCSVCGAVLVEQQEIPVIAHTYDDIYDADCNECGFTRDPACRHSEVEVVEGYDSTCSAMGLTDGSKCVSCGEILVAQEVIELKPHTEVIDARVEATCTSYGLTEGKHCSVCEAILVAQWTISKKSHTYGDWIVDKEVTVTEDGARHKTCGVCGYEQSEILYATGSIGLEYKEYSDGYTVIGLGTCTDKEIVIPAKYNGRNVTSVNSNIFKGTKITSIIIGKNVQSVDDTSECPTLTEIKVHEFNIYLKDIDGVHYRKDGKKLYLIAYPAGRTDTLFEVPYGVTEIHNLSRCRYLTKIIIPDTVTSIGGFMYCTGITSIGPVGSGASVEIPESVTYIRSEAFMYCNSLKSVTIPQSVKYIGKLAFCDCASLAIVKFEDDSNLMSIHERAFLNCCSLTSINIPESVTSIGEGAFSQCYSLIEVCNKSSLNIEAGSEAFGEVGYYAKRIITDESQSAIKQISYEGAGEYIFYDDGAEVYLVKYLSNDFRPILVYYNDGEEYGIWHHAFYRKASSPTSVSVSYLKVISIDIPDDVTEIGEKAFESCDKLSTIVFEGTVEQWEAITKADNWCSKYNKIEVICSDGVITYN